MSSASRDNFTSFFLIWVLLISFSRLIFLVGPPVVPCWSVVVRARVLALFPFLEEKLQSLATERDIGGGLLIHGFLLRYGSFLVFLACWVFSTRKDVEFCQVLFLHQSRKHLLFVLHSVNVLYYTDWFSILFTWCIVLIFIRSNHPCIPSVNPTRSWCYN